jgi:hypothetical protein
LTTYDNLRIVLYDGTGATITFKSFDPSNPANYDTGKAVVGAGGLTFYRYSLSDDGDPARSNANVRVGVVRHTDDANVTGAYYVDGLYIEVSGENSTTPPDAWMSSRNLDNRNDIQSTSQATENYLNYIDVWGIPGDAPALAQWDFNFGNVGVTHDPRAFICSMVTDGYYRADEQRHWIESDDGDITFTAGTGSWSNQTGTTNNHFKRYAATGAGTAKITWAPSSDLLEMAETPRTVYVQRYGVRTC